LLCESRDDADAISPAGDFGLWQVNGSYGAGHSRPVDNAKAAILTYEGT